VKFKQNAKLLTIEIKEISVEAHNSVDKIERYHVSLRRAYKVIRDEMLSSIQMKIVLQMIVKAVNDSIDSDEIVLTLLIFDSYSRMINDSLSSSSMMQRAQIIRKTMRKVQRLHVERQIKYALFMRNESNIEITINLSIQFDVRV
jgi:hypothetical protein